MTKITLEIPSDRNSLVEAIRMLQAVLDTFPDDDLPDEPTAVPAVAPNAGGGGGAVRAPEDGVQAWLDHLGKASRKFWKMVATYLQTHDTLTFEGMEAAYNIPAESLRSYHRNSYRAMKYEQAVNPMPREWDDEEKHMVYTMSAAVRDKILELTRDDPE